MYNPNPERKERDDSDNASRVVITDVDVPFGSMIRIAFQWSLAALIASIPLALMVFVVLVIGTAVCSAAT
jgi:hypothetical protein